MAGRSIRAAVAAAALALAGPVRADYAAGQAAWDAGRPAEAPGKEETGGSAKKTEEDASRSLGRDCPECPEMVAVPAGVFRMGPRRRHVTISEPFAVGKYEVTRGEFASFVSATGRSTGDSCHVNERGEWKRRSDRGWRSPGFPQTDRDPVVCVSWADARAYAAWLSEKTGKRYRLLSESEWVYAARGGTRPSRHWGEGAWGRCDYSNGGDRTPMIRYSDWLVACDDGHFWTTPVGTFNANGFGLHGVLGNVWEWVEDCWNGSYAGAPSDGSARESGNCGRRVLRGGSWGLLPRLQPSWKTDRLGSDTGSRTSEIGFRVARTLAP